jgi:hypothetical protein
VRLFDQTGILYGPIKWDGTPASGVHGYKFRVENGYARSEPVGVGQNGGVCVTRFAQAPFVWRTSFVVNAGGSDLAVWPAILGDMRGNVLSLNVGATGWTWESFPTHLAFRARSPSPRIPATGPLTLQTGTEYSAEISFDGSTLRWTMSNPLGFSAGGSFSTNLYLADDCELGFGLLGTNASVDFGYAELSVLAAADPSAWRRYE